MIRVDAMGDACPIPVVKAKKAIKELGGSGVVEVLVDNPIAVENLTKLAKSLNCTAAAEKKGEAEYCVKITVGEAAAQPEVGGEACYVPAGKKRIVVAMASGKMGEGNDELGAVLAKGFLFALTQQEQLPEAVLFYNGGATLTTEGSPALEDIRTLEAQGVEILTCGTCLNYYGLSDKLAVGGVTNMYVIVEKLTGADLVIRP